MGRFALLGVIGWGEGSEISDTVFLTSWDLSSFWDEGSDISNVLSLGS